MSPGARARLAALSDRLGLGPDPAPILDALRHLYADLDAELAAKSSGLELPCRAGCDACCHESVFVSAPEYLAIAAELLETRTAPELSALLEVMHAVAARFEDELELLETIEPGAERDEVAARVKFRCPLLGEGGACTVYASRELNARTFGQSWDERADAAYGCELTHARLAVIGGGAVGRGLAGARGARAKLVAAMAEVTTALGRDAARSPEVEAEPGAAPTARVHVLPWWFTRFAPVLVG